MVALIGGAAWLVAEARGIQQDSLSLRGPAVDCREWSGTGGHYCTATTGKVTVAPQ
jgi:hypothetical protein